MIRRTLPATDSNRLVLGRHMDYPSVPMTLSVADFCLIQGRYLVPSTVPTAPLGVL